MIMYVGKGLLRRTQFHWKNFLSCGKSVNRSLCSWFEKLKNDGVVPSWRVLEEDVTNWQEAERRWISMWRSRNTKLCNLLDGGDGPPIGSAEAGGRAGIRSQCLRDPNHQSKAGKLGGKVRQKLYPNLSSLTGRKYGSLGGKRVQELYPNHLRDAGRRTNILHPGHAARAGSYGIHVRWHVKRNKPNPKCSLCRPDFFDVWEGQANPCLA
jgi:hypothetical protein